jgi:uncharacterized protein DUF5703/glycosyl hydrolase family 95
MSDSTHLSRRTFLGNAVAAPALAAQLSPSPSAPSKLLNVDFRKLVSRADLTYTKPVTRSEAGMPVGNGRMGSLVWTTPSTLKFQINRPDVFAENRDTNSFPERHTDYGSGCGYVDIDFVDYGDDVFAGDAFRQELAVYDAVMTVRGRGVTARVIGWMDADVIAIEIEDQRNRPAAINVDLRMLRYAMEYLEHENYQLASQRIVRVTKCNQTAASKLDIRDGRIILTQEFREGPFYDSSAVAIGIAGRPAKTKYVNDSAVRLSAAPGKGKFTFLIASAATFDSNQDVAALALAELEKASARGFDAMLAGNRNWWRDFWSKSFVRLHSSDGDANFVEQHHTYLQYLMATTSRGSYPPRFGGMLWFTNGDMREWGAQHWWANASCYYKAMHAVNRPDLMDPVFNMYSKMYDSCALAARQQWGSQGIYIPETVWFDGLEQLPDDIAAEMRELYLFRKPWEQRSQRFVEFADGKAPHNSRWNWKDKGGWVNGRWVYKDKGAGVCGQCNHIFSSGAKIAHQYWLRYEYTQDTNWLRERAYPMLKGIAEFYRNYPNLRKGADGKFHIHDVNNHEPVWAARDTQEEISAMRGTLPLAIRASELLDADVNLRAAWREFFENLAPLPTNESPDAPNPRQAGEPKRWIAGLPPVKKGNLGTPGLVPANDYDLVTMETDDADLVKTAQATYDVAYPRGVGEKTPINVLNRNGAAAAHLGRAADLKYMLLNQLRCLAPDHDFCDWVGGGKTGVLANRLELREGPGAIDAERIGRVSEAMQLGLLQSAPASPGGHPILHVFPTWPKDWDADYTLLARGAFLVTSAIRQGQVEFVELLSQAGGECRLRNPWGQTAVLLHRNGREAESLASPLLQFNTARGETVVVVRRGERVDQYKRAV